MAEAHVIAYIAGKGRTMPVLITKSQWEQLQAMPGKKRQKLIAEIAEKEYKRTKGMFGLCKEKQRVVKVLECVDCARDRGFKTRLAWEQCALQNIDAGEDD